MQAHTESWRYLLAIQEGLVEAQACSGAVGYYHLAVHQHFCCEALPLFDYDTLYEGLPEVISEKERLRVWQLLRHARE